MRIQLTAFFSFLLGTAHALSQGIVLFANTVPFATTADRLVYADVVGGTKLVGTNYFAQLYYGADADHLIAVANEPARFRSPTTTLPGTWTQSPANRTLLGFYPGQQLTLQVRAWDGSFFNTYEDAVAGGGVHGQSDAFEYVIPPPNTPPSPAAFFMENLRAFALNLPLSTNNHAPIAYSQSISIANNTTADLTLVATDIDGDSLTYTLTAPAYGTLTGTPPTVTYTPALGYTGEDYFTFHASDGQLQSEIATVTILISAGGTVYFRNNEPFATAADRLVYADVVGGTKLVGTNYFA